MIDLRPDFLDTLKRLLAEIVPDCEVRVFGSRYNWTATDASDLDLALVGPGKLHWKTLTRLKAALEESSLPYRVDVLDWRAISPEFQKVINQGYEVIQKPELAMSSKEWEMAKWGDLATLEYGKSLRDYQNMVGDVPVYGTNGLIGFTDKPLCLFPSVIIGRKGAYRGVHYSTKPFFVIDTAFYLKPKNDEIDLLFAYYQLLTQDINSMDSGSAIPSTSREDFYNLEIYLPPLPTQRRIADILSALDEKIELNRQTNATLETIAQAIFKEWFVDFNFPGATGEMVQSDLGLIPRGWRVETLGEIITNYDSKRVPLSSRERESRKGIYPYYGAASIVDHIDDFLFDGIYLLMGEDGTVITEDEKPVLQYVTGKFWVNNHTHVLQGKGMFSTEFIYLLLKNTNIKHIVTGAVQPKINQGNMNNLSAIIPDTEPLKAFQDIIKQTFTYIIEIEQQSTTLAAIRNALLPRLMRGEISVNEVY